MSKRAKHDPKLPVSVSHTLYLYISRSISVDHIIKIFGKQMQNNDISRCVSLHFLKSTTLQILKFLRFLLDHFNSFYNNNDK